MTDLLATPVKCTTGRCKGRNVMTRNPDGVCSRHPKGNREMEIATIEEARRALAEAEHDVSADMGDEAVEAGWSDIVHSVADRCTPEVRSELLRTQL